MLKGQREERKSRVAEELLLMLSVRYIWLLPIRRNALATNRSIRERLIMSPLIIPNAPCRQQLHDAAS